jgi:6-phosphofructokinase 1
MAISTGNFLIAQGGGPTAVINASVVGAVREAFRALPDSCEVWGAKGGVTGLFAETFIDLRRQPEGMLEAVRDAPAAALGSSAWDCTILPP